MEATIRKHNKEDILWAWLSAYEPVRSISYKMACAHSEDSNQFANPHSLISLSVPLDETLDPWLPIVRSTKTLIRLRRCAG